MSNLLRGYINENDFNRITGNSSVNGVPVALFERAAAIIDGYVGYWQPARGHLEGVVQQAYGNPANSGDGFYLAPEHRNQPNSVNYLAGCLVEFLSGQNQGALRVIKSVDSQGVVYFDEQSPYHVEPGTIYHIFQAGKFPRLGTLDLRSVAGNGITSYYVVIPQPIKEAVAWQAAYMNELGDEYFNSMALGMQSESFGGYSYNRGESTSGAKAIIAPRARQALAGSGLINRTGQITDY